MNKITSGNTENINVRRLSSLTVVCPNEVTATVLINGVAQPNQTGTVTYGPFETKGTVRVTANGGEVQWRRETLPNRNRPVFARDNSLVDPDGNELLGQVVGGGVSMPGAMSGSTRPTRLVFGNSIARLAARNGHGGGINQQSGLSWIWHFDAYSGLCTQPVRTGYQVQYGNANAVMTDGVFGWSGATTVALAGVARQVFEDARIAAASAGQTLDLIIIHALENDPVAIAAGTITLAQSAAAIREIISIAGQFASRVIVNGCLPSADYNTAAETAAARDVTVAAEIATREAGAMFVPMNDLYADSSSQNYVPLNSGVHENFVVTDVHPVRAASLIGRRVADAVARFGYESLFHLGFVNTPRFLGGNPLMTGSGGTLTNLTGAAPANVWARNLLTTPTVGTAAIVSEMLPRQALDIAVASTTSQQRTVAIQVGIVNPITTGYAEGDLVQAYFDVEFSRGVGMRNYDVELSCTGASSALFPLSGIVAYPQEISSGTLDLPVQSGRRMIVATHPAPVPPGTTDLRPFFKAYTAHIATANIDIACRVRGFGVLNLSR